MEKGYTNASALLGGTAAWKNAALPMESSPEDKIETNKTEINKTDKEKTVIKKEDAKDAKDVKKP